MLFYGAALPWNVYSVRVCFHLHLTMDLQMVAAYTTLASVPTATFPEFWIQ